MKMWLALLFCINAVPGNATVHRTIDAEGASIDASSWALSDNGFNYPAVTKGEPDAPWLSPSQFVSGGHSVGYNIYPTSGLYEGQTMDKINHAVLSGSDAGALTFGQTRYTAFYVKLSDSFFQIPEGTCILVQWWQGTPHNPPVSLQILPDTPSNQPPQFAFFCKEDETGGRPSETARMIFQGEMTKGDWHHFIVKITPNYIGNPSGEKAEIKVWHNGKLLSSLVNTGSAYTGYCGYKPASLGGIAGANNNFGTYIGIYRSRQMKRTQVFFDDVEFSDSYVEPSGNVEEERYSAGTCGISVEMENCNRITSPMVAATAAGASAGEYLWVPEGTGNGAGEATYQIEIPQDGAYYLWMRASAPNAAGDSYSAAFNTNSFVDCVLRSDAEWRWNVAGPFWLNAGVNSLTVKNREDGAKLDCFHIGTLYQSPPVEKREVLIEAENSRITSPMGVFSDSAAWAGHYVATPNGCGNGSGGLIEWSFDLELPAALYVWGRVYAPTGSDNSFYIRKSGDLDFLTWSFPEDASDYIWRKFGTPFYFSAGRNSVVVGTREDGTQIDKIYIGNGDPATLE